MKYFASRISENIHTTPEGYLLALAVPIGRTGEMEYGVGETPLEAGSDGIVRVDRSAKELFRPETLASFEGKPFTIGHPTDFVNPKNWQSLAKGVIQNVRRKGEDVIADILITDQFAISLVEQGVRQLSCGYEAEYVQTGVGTGSQKNIIGNHLALVEEGRAGDAYAINDEKGVFRMNKKLAEMLKSLFGKTVDQALAAELKNVKAKVKAKTPAKVADAAPGHDELVAICKDLMDKVEKMGQPQDAAEEEEVVVDQEEPAEVSMEDRLKKLEMAVSKLLEGQATEAGDEEEEEVVEDEESEEVVEDEAEEEVVEDEGPKLTGDEKSRVEILAPGMVPTKDFKAQALKSAYKTEDGKAAIDAICGGKPDFTKNTEMLFVSASEVLKAKRGGQLASTKKTRDFSSTIFAEEGAMSAEKMNELNAKHYNQKK